MTAPERTKRETEALGVLDAATRVTSGAVEHTVSADAQSEMT